MSFTLLCVHKLTSYKYFVNLGTLLTIKVRGVLFVCLNKMFYEHSLDVNETGSVYWPVHLYTHTKILEIRFLLRILH